MSAPHELGRAYETSLSVERRRRDGIHYTPPPMAAELVAAALEEVGTMPRTVCDPACGAGSFLLATLYALVDGGLAPSDALGRIRGLDVDADAIAVARRALGDWAVAHGLDARAVPDDAVGVVDALVDEWPIGVDMVVGNPPFGGQLRGSTVRDERRAEVAARLLGRRAGYADTAGLFLARAVAEVTVGGVVVLVQPLSVLAARDAGPVRDRISSCATVRGLRFPDPSGFDASVHVCAPVIVRDGGPTPREWSEIAADALALTDAPADDGMGLGAVAEVTAGFRDEFYAVAAHVVEADPHDVRPRLVTSGSIEPGRILWGERPSRVRGRSLLHPVVEVEALADWARSAPDGRRLAARLGRRTAPKILVATQTRALEAVVDVDGSLWPSVPVVSVLPRDDADSPDLWELFAVLVSREASAFIARRSFGTGLSRGAVRVSAGVLAELPLPSGVDAWRCAADGLRGGLAVDDPDVLDAMSRAYGLVGRSLG